MCVSSSHMCLVLNGRSRQDDRGIARNKFDPFFSLLYANLMIARVIILLFKIMALERKCFIRFPPIGLACRHGTSFFFFSFSFQIEDEKSRVSGTANGGRAQQRQRPCCCCCSCCASGRPFIRLLKMTRPRRTPATQHCKLLPTSPGADTLVGSFFFFFETRKEFPKGSEGK